MKKIDTVCLSQHWIPAIINGDVTGLTDEEDIDLDVWLEKYPNCIFTVKAIIDDFWSKDAVTGLYSTCYEVDVYQI